MSLIKFFKNKIVLFLIIFSFILFSCSKNTDYDPNEIPLTFEAINNGEIFFKNLQQISNLKYKKNKEKFKEIKSNISIRLSSGDKVVFIADGTNNDYFKFFSIQCTSDCYIYGNVMSLLNSTKYSELNELSPFAFYGLFCNNRYIKNHENNELILPATILNENCYGRMFEGCSKLSKAPSLPAISLANGCYVEMFRECTSITIAPKLPATQLSEFCYECMFAGCTSLNGAPELNSVELAKYCYTNMFRGCTSLNVAPKLPATILKNNCYAYMFGECTSLLTVPDLPANELADCCYRGMFMNCISLTKVPKTLLELQNISYNDGMFSGCTNIGK
ncbi:MAG: hypothetical protein IK002_05180 [Treponema sp.]|uniref:hypothetical protein n=1 Tax=Treponema sp. TaxID=166 RepID=UPI00298EBED4|nr:hypothetical protein [Treponema sp.]MBR5933362.1 hypothetical protein [Treponema sp.]